MFTLRKLILCVFFSSKIQNTNGLLHADNGIACVINKL